MSELEKEPEVNAGGPATSGATSGAESQSPLPASAEVHPEPVHRTKRLGMAVAAILIVAGLHFVNRIWIAPAAGRSAATRDQKHPMAPNFSLKDLNGNKLDLADYKGKVVLLDFWATWCGPCRIEIPWFMEMERQNKDKGFEVLGVAMDDEGWEAVKPFLAELKVNYRVVIGNDETAREYGGVDALPTTFLIDREGKVAAIHIGLDANRKD